jgi:hypothetical protein
LQQYIELHARWQDQYNGLTQRRRTVERRWTEICKQRKRTITRAPVRQLRFRALLIAYGLAAARLVPVAQPLHAPVKDVVVLVALAHEEVAEELAEVAVVGLVVETKRATIAEEVRKMPNSLGKPRQRSSVGVVIFFSITRSYLCFLVAALRPCQGSWPRKKYMRT